MNNILLRHSKYFQNFESRLVSSPCASFLKTGKETAANDSLHRHCCFDLSLGKGNPSAFSLFPGGILQGGLRWHFVQHSLACRTRRVRFCVCSERALQMYCNCTFDNTVKKSLLSEREICVLLESAVLAEYKGSPKQVSWQETEGGKGTLWV